jgi:hypothetical protein
VAVDVAASQNLIPKEFPEELTVMLPLNKFPIEL